MRRPIQKRSSRVASASAVAALLLAVAVSPAAARRTSGDPAPSGRIAFASDRRGDRDVWVMDTDGGNTSRVAKGGPLSAIYRPVWAPDGTRIAFLNVNTQPTDSDPDDDDTTRVWVVDADGANLVQLTPGTSYVSTLTWSPDGARIAFDEGAYGTIEAINTDGTNRTVLAQNPIGCCLDHPTWSPDGSQIAYELSYGVGSGIWVMNADGTNHTQLTTDPPDAMYNPYDRGPAWSPDSTRIAFSRLGDGQFEIWVMNADGSDPVRVTATDPGSFVGDLEWSPDGTTIAFTSREADTRDVWVVGADGGEPTNLTGEADGASPSWSPDGTRIAFESSRTGDSEIWVMDADGSDPVQLTDSPGFDGAPDWQPVTEPVSTPPERPRPRDKPRHRDRPTPSGYWSDAGDTNPAGAARNLGSWSPRYQPRHHAPAYLTHALRPHHYALNALAAGLPLG